MFLTTESVLLGRTYERVRVISGAEKAHGENSWEVATENALGKLYMKAIETGADGVIGVQISTSLGAGPSTGMVVVIGTAIRFLDNPAKTGNDRSDALLL